MQDTLCSFLPMYLNKHDPRDGNTKEKTIANMIKALLCNICIANKRTRLDLPFISSFFLHSFNGTSFSDFNLFSPLLSSDTIFHKDYNYKTVKNIVSNVLLLNMKNSALTDEVCHHHVHYN